MNKRLASFLWSFRVTFTFCCLWRSRRWVLHRRDQPPGSHPGWAATQAVVPVLHLHRLGQPGHRGRGGGWGGRGGGDRARRRRREEEKSPRDRDPGRRGDSPGHGAGGAGGAGGAEQHRLWAEQADGVRTAGHPHRPRQTFTRIGKKPSNSSIEVAVTATWLCLKRLQREVPNFNQRKSSSAKNPLLNYSKIRHFPSNPHIFGASCTSAAPSFCVESKNMHEKEVNPNKNQSLDVFWAKKSGFPDNYNNERLDVYSFIFAVGGGGGL